MKKYVMMALAAIVMMTSCNKEEEAGNNATRASLTVSIDMSKFTTKSGDGTIYDGSGTAIPTWASIYFVVTDKNSAAVTLVKSLYTSSEVTSGTPVVLIEKAEGTAATDLIDGTIKAYLVTTGNDWGTMSGTNLPTLAAGQLDINNWQASGTISGSIAGTFVNIPYYGDATIAQTGVMTDSHIKLEAAITATPELGRIQVINTPLSEGSSTIGSVTTVVKNLVFKGIYINKITSNSNVVDIRTVGANVAPGWEAAFYGSTMPLVGMWDATTGKGYHIFDGNTPHLIVKIEYELETAGVNLGTKHIGYLTIQKFKFPNSEQTDDTDGLTVNKGKIYTINLGALTPKYNEIGDEPYDNTVYYDLVATVTVAPWTIINVTPEL